MYGIVLEPIRVGQPVPGPHRPERLAGVEGLEDLFRRARVDDDDPVVRAQAQVQDHALGRNLGEQCVVAAEELVGISSQVRDGCVHGRSYRVVVGVGGKA